MAYGPGSTKLSVGRWQYWSDYEASMPVSILSFGARGDEKKESSDGSNSIW
ncbi:MAG: hypothetical protein NZ807_09710 [Dehalococcoidia bacterium]|nr:hypothetical protein [Dehalococcoidia bacterium]